MVQHGPVNCSRCWSDSSAKVQECGAFRLVRDPGHWGATDPHTLVLGISKGNTQSKAFANEHFDGVAFKKMRPRMLEGLQAVGVLGDDNASRFDRRFSTSETDFAFASVVRCSITGWNEKKGLHTAESPCVVPAFKEGSAGYKFVESCVSQHLVPLPPRTKRVLLLGNDDKYADNLAEVIGRCRGPVRHVNPMSYVSSGILFVHLAHPSPANGHFGAFIEGKGKQGKKRDWARQAIAAMS